MKKTPIILLKCDQKTTNLLKSFMRELDKILKVHMRIHNNLLTSQNSSSASMSLSGIIFNLVSSLTNETTAPPIS